MARKLTAVPTRRESQRVNTRNRLFDLCVEEFRRVGVEKARIRDVVERAGVVPGTFYFHFPSKQHVLAELANRYVAQVADQLPGSDGQVPDLESFLDGLADATIALEREIGDTALLRAAVSTFQQPPSDAPLDSARLQLALRASISQQVTESSELGLNVDELSVLILTAFFGLLLVGPEDPEARAEQIRRSLRFFARAFESGG